MSEPRTGDAQKRPHPGPAVPPETVSPNGTQIFSADADFRSPFDLFESQEQAQFNPDTFAEALKRTAIDITRQYAKHLLPIVLLTLNMLLGVSL